MKFLPLFRRCTFRKTTEGSQIEPPYPPPPTVLGLSFVKILNFSIERCLILMAFLEEMVICVTLVTFVTKDF